MSNTEQKNKYKSVLYYNDLTYLIESYIDIFKIFHSQAIIFRLFVLCEQLYFDQTFLEIVYAINYFRIITCILYVYDLSR